MMRRLIHLLLALTICLTFTAGCAQTTERIVYVGYARPPQATGALRVATSEPLPVTVVGKSDRQALIRVGGWYLVSPPDLAAFLKLAQEKHKETEADNGR